MRVPIYAHILKQWRARIDYQLEHTWNEEERAKIDLHQPVARLTIHIPLETFIRIADVLDDNNPTIEDMAAFLVDVGLHLAEEVKHDENREMEHSD